MKGKILLSVFNPGDRDTHVQYRVPNAAVYPFALPPITLFGLAVENVPPYKDPESLPTRLGDPVPGQLTAHVGTFKWDTNHAWFELHPVKMVRELDPAREPELAAIGGREAPEVDAWPADGARVRGAE